MNKNFLALALSLPLFMGVSVVANATSSGLSSSDEHGCKALMCFSGGMGLGECQSTINKVYKDLAKGKSFPKCSFIGGKNDTSGSNANDPSISKFTTHSTKKNVYLYKDGVLIKKIKK